MRDVSLGIEFLGPLVGDLYSFFVSIDFLHTY